MELWLAGFRHFWTPHLDRLDAELTRSRRQKPKQRRNR